MDVLGCIVVDEIDIDIVDDFILDIIVINLFCFGDENGSILVEGWGGILFYIYQWSNGVIGILLFENIGVGNYSVIVMDQNGCQFIENFVLVDFFILVVMINVIVEVCLGEFIGIVMVVGMGGMFFYIYEWNIGVII